MKKQQILRLASALLLMIMICSSCQNKNEFTVKGVVSGADGLTLYIENVGISEVTTLDSLKINPAGKFKFTQPRPSSPEFYRLRLNSQLINFAVDSTETVDFTIDAGTFATSYSVEGSDNNIAIKNITLAQLDANQAYNRLRREFEGKQIADTTYTQLLEKAVNDYKEMARKYIFGAPMSTAAYFALFQKIDGLLFFDLYDRDDSKAFAAVATSLNHNYPESARSKHLYNLTLQSIKVIRAQRDLDLENYNMQTVGFLDIELPDAWGNKRKLSEIAENRVTLINFTAYMTEWSAELNIELGTLYEKYRNKGLQIYQVSLDSDAHLWRNAAANIPWIAVRDPESVYSQVAAMYNVKQLPALFILDKKGNLIKRVEDFSILENDIKSLL